MGKTLILGNNREAYWIKDFPEDIVKSVNKISVNREEELSAFLERTLPQDLEILLIDIDSIEDTETALQLALRLRLMLYTFKKASLCHIVFVSDLGIESYIDHGIASVLLMTKNVSIAKGGKLLTLMDSFKSMTSAEYVTGFLNLIKIVPQSNFEGRHSIANEWGAEVLAKVISGGVEEDILKVKVSVSLYFKYCSVVSLNANDVNNIIQGKTSQFLLEKRFVKGKFNYLLIDDEAEKGWSDVLNLLLPEAHQTLVKDKVEKFGDLPESIKKNIYDGEYEIIFLDLRMLGPKEESVARPKDFSGMKILESIKSINRGIQVIMLTATNKSWNLQALLNSGANGYYMKEAPEYHFPIKYSEQNAITFIDTIKNCLKNSFLQDIYFDIQHTSLPSDLEISSEIIKQLNLSFNLIENAINKNDIALSYIALEQVFEISTSNLIEKIGTYDGYEYVFTHDIREKCKNYENLIPKGYLYKGKTESEIPQWKKVCAIYYQLFNGKDTDFISKVKPAISLRNSYIHPKGKEVEITRDDYRELFYIIMEFLNVFK